MSRMVLCVALVMLLGFGLRSDGSGKSLETKRGLGRAYCGVNCLAVVCKVCGIETSAKELVALSGTNDFGDASMAGLMDAAKAKGLHVVGCRLSLDELAELPCISIAHLQNGHFIGLPPILCTRSYESYQFLLQRVFRRAEGTGACRNTRGRELRRRPVPYQPVAKVVFFMVMREHARRRVRGPYR